jgi:hypothetical protein
MNNIRQHIDQIFTEHKLLGNQDFTASEYSAMVDAVGKLCQNNPFRKTDYKFIVFTLVEIAKRWKESYTHEDHEDNRGFWCFIFKTLTGIDEYKPTLYRQFTSLISEMGKRNQISVVKTGKKYYATLMMHAFAPKKSIHSFFDLCYNIFKKDLDFGFTNDDEWLCEIVAKQITSVLKNGYREDKVVSIGSSAYSIEIGLRSFALHEDLSENFAQFIRDTFEQINKLFNKEKFIEETRLQRYIVEWWKNKTENEKISDNTTGKKRIATVSKQNIAAKYVRDDDAVFLCIPSIRLDDENNKMQLTIYVDGEQYSSEEMRTKRGELVVATKSKELELNELLKSDTETTIIIRVEIKENGTVIFDSDGNKTTSLHREFILFEGEKEIFSQINKPSNYFVYSKDIDALQKPDELKTFSTNLYNIYPKAGENLTGKTKQVFFVDKAKVVKSSNTICLLGNLPDIEWVLDDIHCLVYKDSVKLIVPENTNLKALELKIDSKTYKLDNFSYEQLQNNCFMFGLLKLGLLKQNEPVELSLYSYEKEMTVFTETLIVLPNLNINFSNSVFYGDIERKVRVSKSSELTWSNQDNEIKCQLNNGVLLIKIPYLRWRINEKEWHNEPIKRKLWYKDFLSNGDLLEIDNPNEGEEIKIDGTADGEFIEITKNQSGKYEIGRAIYNNEEKKDIAISCFNAKEKFELFNVATKEHFIENPMRYNNGKALWDVENTFIGDKDNEFSLVIKSDTNNLIKEIGNENSEISNLYEDVCKIEVKIKEKNIFLQQTAYKLIFKGTLIVGDPQKLRFKNKKIKLLSANCFRARGRWLPFAPKYFIDNLQFVQEDENVYYKGQLCVIDKNDKTIVLNTMKNKDNQYDKINPVRIELRDNSTLWLVAGYKGKSNFIGDLFYDRQQKYICNIEQQNRRYYEINLYKFEEEEYV